MSRFFYYSISVLCLPSRLNNNSDIITLKNKSFREYGIYVCDDFSTYDETPRFIKIRIKKMSEFNFKANEFLVLPNEKMSRIIDDSSGFNVYKYTLQSCCNKVDAKNLPYIKISDILNVYSRRPLFSISDCEIVDKKDKYSEGCRIIKANLASNRNAKSTFSSSETEINDNNVRCVNTDLNNKSSNESANFNVRYSILEKKQSINESMIRYLNHLNFQSFNKKKDLKEFIFGYDKWDFNSSFETIQKNINMNSEKIHQNKLRIQDIYASIYIPKNFEKEIKKGDLKYYIKPKNWVYGSFANDISIKKLKKKCENSFLLKIINQIKCITISTQRFQQETKIFLNLILCDKRDIYSGKFFRTSFVILDFREIEMHFSEIKSGVQSLKRLNRYEERFCNAVEFTLCEDRNIQIKKLLEIYGVFVPEILLDGITGDIINEPTLVSINDKNFIDTKTKAKVFKSGTNTVYQRITLFEKFFPFFGKKEVRDKYNKSKKIFVQIRDDLLERMGEFKSFFTNDFMLPKTVNLKKNSDLDIY